MKKLLLPLVTLCLTGSAIAAATFGGGATIYISGGITSGIPVMSLDHLQVGDRITGTNLDLTIRANTDGGGILTLWGSPVQILGPDSNIVFRSTGVHTPTFQYDIELENGATINGNGAGLSNTVDQTARDAHSLNLAWTAKRLRAATGPLRLGGIGDSLGDDTPLALLPTLTNAFGLNGGYLTTTAAGGSAPPLVYITNGPTVALADTSTNWWATHFILGPGDTVTFTNDSGNIDADTFRVAYVQWTNGGDFQTTLSTNGGAYTALGGTVNGLKAGGAIGVVQSLNTNRGLWTLQVTNISGTNIIIGAGLWASNKPGVRLSALWQGGVNLGQVLSVSTNILVPILSDLALDLALYKNYDNASITVAQAPVLANLLSMAVTNGDFVGIAVHPVIGDATDNVTANLALRSALLSGGYQYLDGYTPFYDTNAMAAAGFFSDAVHLTSAGCNFIADLFMRESGLGELALATTSFPTTFGRLSSTNRWTGRQTFPDGDASNPTLGWTSDDDGTGTGLYRRAANEVSVTLGGANRFRFNTTYFNVLSDTILIALGASADAFIGRAAAGVLWAQNLNVTNTLGTKFLVVSNTISAPTNVASFTIATTDLALDTDYTNAQQRAMVSLGVVLNATVSDPAEVSMWVDQDGDGTYEQNLAAATAGAGVVRTDTQQLTAFLQPGARLVFSNLCSGAATASVLAGSVQWVKQ